MTSSEIRTSGTSGRANFSWELPWCHASACFCRSLFTAPTVMILNRQRRERRRANPVVSPQSTQRLQRCYRDRELAKKILVWPAQSAFFIIRSSLYFLCVLCELCGEMNFSLQWGLPGSLFPLLPPVQFPPAGAGVGTTFSNRARETSWQGENNPNAEDCQVLVIAEPPGAIGENADVGRKPMFNTQSQLAHGSCSVAELHPGTAEHVGGV
jgi:hypothetical protein